MKNFVFLVVCAVCALVSIGFASPDSLYSQAQKLYSQGNFEAAAKIYAGVCSEFEAKKKKVCQFNEVKALTESQKIDMARAAEPKLLSLISQTEPGDSLFAELSAEDAKLQIMLNQPVRAVRSWNSAQASANVNYFSEIFVLCKDIISAFPANGLTAENCDKIKPADTTLISLPRKKITPLTTTQAKNPTSNPQSLIPNPQNATTPASQSGKWYIQLGAFGNRDNAEKLVADFKNKGIQLYIAELTDRKLFAVRTGTFANREDAENYAEQKIAPLHSGYKIFQ